MLFTFWHDFIMPPMQSFENEMVSTQRKIYHRALHILNCQSLFSSQKKTLLHHADFLWLPKVTKVGFKRA